VGSRGLLRGGTTGNELLTTVTGAVLIVLLAVIGITIIRLTPLLSVHLFVGLVLVGPLSLKLASTGYRFVGYYTGNLPYRSKGAPPTPLRLIAPIVILSTLTVMGSGIALLFAGPRSRHTLLPIHKVSFFIWLAFTSIHIIGHLPTLWQGLRADYAPSSLQDQVTDGRAGRVLALISTLVLGVIIAILLIPQFGPWLHAHSLPHR
jgi:hypothetical protein